MTMQYQEPRDTPLETSLPAFNVFERVLASQIPSDIHTLPSTQKVIARRISPSQELSEEIHCLNRSTTYDSS